MGRHQADNTNIHTHMEPPKLHPSRSFSPSHTNETHAAAAAIQVAAFLRACLRQLLPPALLGSGRNLRAFVDGVVHAYLQGTKEEREPHTRMDGWKHTECDGREYTHTYTHTHTCTYTHTHVRACAGGGTARASLSPARLAASLRLKDVTWAAAKPKPPPSSSSSASLAQAAAAATTSGRSRATTANPAEWGLRRQLLERVVALLASELVLPLLRGCFYVTEADGTGGWVGGWVRWVDG